MQIPCFIVDDEPLAVELMESYVRRTPFLHCVGTYTNGIDAFAALKQIPVQLIFMDIQMPYISGLELSKIIDTYQIKIIFTTAFDQYAVEGFRVNALDYLLKPISYDHFLDAAERAKRYFLDTQNRTDNALAGSITIKADYKLHRIEFRDILYIESLRDYVCFHLIGGDTIQTLSTLKNMESSLPDSHFIRIHRSFIVNLKHVDAIERGHMVLKKVKLPISDAYKDPVLLRFGKERT